MPTVSLCMVIKDEASSGYGNLHICTPTQPLTTWANMSSDFWSDMSPTPFAGETFPPDYAAAEGPGGIEIGGISPAGRWS